MLFKSSERACLSRAVNPPAWNVTMVHSLSRSLSSDGHLTVKVLLLGNDFSQESQ